MKQFKDKCGCNGRIPEPPLSCGDGQTPYIGTNGNWWIGLTDTGVKAAGTNGTNGTNGTDGLTPFIGENGNWWIGTIDTEVKAEGKDGANGTPATVTVGTTTTLPPNSSATVVNIGTPSDAILNFGIPQGVAGGAANPIHASMIGVLLNDANNPSLVLSGKYIPWKVIKDNGQGLLLPAPDNSFFQFSKTGRYICHFHLRCSTTISADNGVFNWGLFAQSIQKEMVTSASAYLTPNMVTVSGVNMFDVKDITEKYNFINNSLFTVKVQGAQSTQLFTNKFVGVNGVNVIDGMSVSFIRIAD